MSFLNLVSAVLYTLCFGLGFLSSLRLFLLDMVVYLVGGAVVSLCMRHIANTRLVNSTAHSVQQEVELLYSFDCHCNGFLVFFMYLHVAQLLLLPLILKSSFLGLLLSNILYTLAISHYFYVTHLGYRALPFLRDTEVFLYPVVPVVVMFACSILLYPLGVELNVARFVMWMVFE